MYLLTNPTAESHSTLNSNIEDNTDDIYDADISIIVSNHGKYLDPSDRWITTIINGNCLKPAARMALVLVGLLKEDMSTF